MKTELLWTDKVPEKDASSAASVGSEARSNVVYDMAFKPDGSHVLVAVGSRIVVYDCEDGMVQHTLRAHKDSVYCLAYARDGKFFASGSADKNVIIWKDTLEGILKYSHNESIQCLAYNPVTGQLASGSTSDFGLWSPEQKNVQKFKVSARVLCASWTNDGQHLALGQLNGHVSIRDKLGNEKARIERSAPVWTLQFSPAPGGREALGGGSAAVGVSGDGKADVASFRETLAVGCWDKTLSFYGVSGVQIGKDKPLDFDPCSLAFFSPIQAAPGSDEAAAHCDYIAVGGSDRKVSLFSRDGQLLKEICARDDWVWCVRARPKAKQLVVGCNDGSVSMFQLTFNTVHGLYRDRYAYRDTLTELVVQHLLSDRKTRIKCKDYIKKIAVYKDRLAVQLTDRVLIYEDAETEDPLDMHYKLKEKIPKKLECNLLVVTSQHLMLCTDKKLQLLDFKGNKVREWVLDAAIRYIRVVGGPSGREGLLVGLKNGGVFKIFVDNGFPVPLIKHDVGIRCLDLSSSRRKLAVVDEQQRVLVYDLITQQVLFQEFNANSVAWNTELEDMLCYSGAGQLCIKTGDFPVHRQPLQGFVVGFNGAKIFCLHFLSMQTIDVPQSASLQRYIERKDFENAYRVACLGVTDSDWRELALSSLQHLSLDVARKALIRVRDVRFLELLQRVEVARRAAGGSGLSTANELALVAEVLAYQGMFPQAAQLWLRAGRAKQAVEMFLDLRDWERAKALVEQVAAREEGKAEGISDLNMLQLMERQADWLLESGDRKGAAELYWGSKKLLKAVSILGENGFADELAAKVRQLNKLQRTELEAAAMFLRKLGKLDFACEAMLKLEDYKGLLALYVESGRWDAAFALVDQHPEPSLNLAALIYSPYADYLASKGDYIGAQQALVRAGRPQESLRMQQSLCANAVSERRFQDAAHHTWLVAAEHRKLANEIAAKAAQTEPSALPALSSELATHANAFVDAMATAELLFAYHLIHRYTDEPFTALQPETIFQTALYILNRSAAPSAPSAGAIDSDGSSGAAGPKSAAIELPDGVSRSQCLYALAKQAHSLGAYRLARNAYDRLLNLRLPNAWRDQIECAWLAVRARPYSDREELQTVCYRCSSPNPLMAAPLDRCVNCGHQFIRSFCSFETLPLVEFTIEEDISEEEALQLIETEPAASAHSQPRGRREQQSDDGAVQTLRFDDDASEHEDEKGPSAPQDQFQQQLMVVDPDASGAIPPIRLDRSGLLACPRKEVFVRKSGFESSPGSLPFRPVQYFRSVLPEIPIHLCGACGHFFHLEDFEFHVLQKHACPFCRVAVPDDF